MHTGKLSLAEQYSLFPQDRTSKEIFYVSICVKVRVCIVPGEAKRGHKVSLSWGYLIMNFLIKVLETELGSSARAANTLNC